jgi:hypothetical protein
MARIEVLTEMMMKITFPWGVRSCSLVHRYSRFGELFSLLFSALKSKPSVGKGYSDMGKEVHDRVCGRANRRQ